MGARRDSTSSISEILESWLDLRPHFVKRVPQIRPEDRPSLGRSDMHIDRLSVLKAQPIKLFFGYRDDVAVA